MLVQKMRAIMRPSLSYKGLSHQGLRGVGSDEAGVYIPHPWRSVQAYLCRLHHGKSKVMHFRGQVHKGGPDVGSAVDGIAFSQPPRQAGLMKGGVCTPNYGSSWMRPFLAVPI